MKKVKLGDLGKIITGNTPSKKTLEFYDSNDIPFIKPDDFKTIDEISSSKGNKNYISENARNSARVVPKNSVLVTCIGIIGKVMISESELSFNQQINAIVPNELILSKYLAYLLLYNKPKLDFISNAPVVPIINKTQFSEFEVTFHEDIDVQEKIIQNLEILDNQILKRRHQSRLLLNLVKSRFNEMFGDVLKFDVEKLNKSVKEMFIGPFGSSLKNDCFASKEKAYCMVYEQKHAIKKTMNLETRYVDEKKYKELKRFSIYGGDIIVSCRGTIGEIFQVPNNAPLGIMHPSIMKIRLDNSKYNPIFFKFMLSDYMDIEKIKSKGSGVKMAITASELGKIEFPLPPLSLQNEFADFVAQVDKSQLAIQKSLEELETLKKSLMQEYFG